jgi:hypothetical protein
MLGGVLCGFHFAPENSSISFNQKEEKPRSKVISIKAQFETASTKN